MRDMAMAAAIDKVLTLVNRGDADTVLYHNRSDIWNADDWRTNMNMQGHILTALREQFNRWEELLASMSDAQICASQLPLDWSIKDVVAHLRAWQQRSIARLEAAVLESEPQFPKWLPEVDPDSDGNTDQINAWIYEVCRELSWTKVHQDWREGFQRFLELGEEIAEGDLLDAERYPWLDGRPLAFILLASYDHHQEHLEKLLTWLQEHRA
jgi:hypothetical protein